MPLPTPDEISWTNWSNDYRIITPTFRLTPIEKPDMSPFLLHMTGKNAILSILRGENAPDDVVVPDDHGYLQANVPEYNQKGYNARVVCFSESPTFAVDFFRYRSIRRWRADQRFGIGFDKADLVRWGVRPVIYADAQLLQLFVSLFEYVENEKASLSSDVNLNRQINKLVRDAYPLLFPLLEQQNLQGFMWEREWRYPNSSGFVFNRDSIRIICCPSNEEHEIRQILGEAAEGIDFVRAWLEYDDVTSYLRRQQPIWQAQSNSYVQAETPEKAEPYLRNLIQQYKIALHSLNSYRELVTHMSNEMTRLNEESNKLEMKLKSYENDLKMIEENAPTHQLPPSEESSF